MNESASTGTKNLKYREEKSKQFSVIAEKICLLYTSDAADDMQCVDLGGRRIIKKSIAMILG